MMNLRTSHIICGKTWIIHRKICLWKYGPQLLHKLRWWSLFYRERYVRLLQLWTLEGPIQLSVTCQFWFEYPRFHAIEECAPLLENSFQRSFIINLFSVVIHFHSLIFYNTMIYLKIFLFYKFKKGFIWKLTKL